MKQSHVICEVGKTLSNKDFLTDNAKRKKNEKNTYSIRMVENIF